jgi:hypothetical protein
MVQPCEKAQRKPMTRPKQWKRGGGQHITSSVVSDKISPVNVALLMRFLVVASSSATEYNSTASLQHIGPVRQYGISKLCVIRVCDELGSTYICESIEAFGEPVVPVSVSE